MNVFDKVNLFNQKGGWETSFILRIARLLRNTFREFGSAIMRAGYSSRTIAEYFRKQGAQIGEYCDINVNSLGFEPYLVNIGNHVFISTGVTFHTHDGGVWIFRDKDPEIHVYGPIVIEDNCIIGMNVMLLPNVRIGRNSVIGAGSVVISDIPPNSIVMGVPARVISSVSKYEERCFAKWKEQRPPDFSMNEGQDWRFLKENPKKLRRHLENLFANQVKQEEKEAEK